MLRFLPLLIVFVLHTTVAAQTSTPLKTTNARCGAYTVRVESNGWDDPPDRLSLMRGNTAVVTLEDISVSLNFCRDITGDGVPEAMVAQYSGGMHCCTIHNLYSLESLPRRILHVDSEHTSELTVKQLDGKGPLELIGDDWRFAYSYGMSFAGSPALPVVYAYHNGQYIDDTRNFPGLVLGRTVHPGSKELYSSDYLHDYAALLLVGKPGEAATFLRGLPTAQRAWLENYGPDIRQNMADFGMQDWPARLGNPPENLHWGVGGAFTAPGQREYLSVVEESRSLATLRLYGPQHGTIQASTPLMTFRLDPAGSARLPDWHPAFTVRRSNKRDDAVIDDARSGSTRCVVVRANTRGLTEPHDDALSAAVVLMGDFTALAHHVASQFDSGNRTASQRAEVTQRIETVAARATPWLQLTGSQFDLKSLGLFDIHGIEMPLDSATEAVVMATVDAGVVAPDQKDTFTLGRRYTLRINLHKDQSRWHITSWTLSERMGELP